MGLKNIISFLQGKAKGKDNQIGKVLDNQGHEQYKLGKLEGYAKEFKESGKKSFGGNFYYGLDGPSQPVEVSRFAFDKGVVELSKCLDIDNNRKFETFDILFNNGEYVSFRTENNVISNLIVRDSKNVFREVNIEDLPLPGTSLNVDDIIEAIQSINPTSLTSSENENLEK